MSEPLPEDLRHALEATAPARGAYGAPAYFFPQTASTNDVAASLAEHGAPEGTMVVARAQTAGRGRLGREWFSPPGAGLYVSFICRNPRVAPLVTLAAGVAVADGVRRSTGLPVVIKWPNDVVMPDSAVRGGYRKLAGVLAEASTSDGSVRHIVVGVGLNVRPAAYPPEVAWRATCLEAELGRPVDAPAVLVQILAAFNEQLSGAAEGDAGALLKRWRELAPSATGRRVAWSAGDTVYRGTTAGVDDDGALLVDTGARTERILSGEVIWL